MPDLVDRNMPKVIFAAITETPITPIFGLVEVNSSVPRIETVREDVADSVEWRSVSVIPGFKAEADVCLICGIHSREVQRADACPHLECSIHTFDFGREIGRIVVDL